MKYDRSAELLGRSQSVMGGGTASDIRAHWGKFQLVLERGLGSRVWDADGNEYIDYTVGGGPATLGHCAPQVMEAIRRQTEKGIIFGGQTTLDIELAEMIQSLVPCAERVRFGTTGSEVVHAALRLARAITGRRKILRFEGHYHGWYDNIAWDSLFHLANPGPKDSPFFRPYSPGQSASDGDNLLCLPWNDLERVEKLFKREGNQIAAIISEPVMSRFGIGPEPGYLEGLREICDRSGSLLIFDEVVTGFRWALGGAQAYYGVTPDLALFAKGLGGGAPVSALAGKARHLDRWREFMPILAGTYSANPLSMAAAAATLRALGENDGAKLKWTHQAADELAQGVEKLIRASGQELLIRRFPSSFHLSYAPSSATRIVDARTFCQTDLALTAELSFELQERGIRVAQSGGWGLMSSHTSSEIEETLVALDGALKALADRKPRSTLKLEEELFPPPTKRISVWQRFRALTRR